MTKRKDTEAPLLPDHNHYQILEIDRLASADEVKKAYHRLSKKYHPDKCNSTGATQAFQLVAQAYETLSNEFKRLKYDESHSNPWVWREMNKVTAMMKALTDGGDSLVPDNTLQTFSAAHQFLERHVELGRSFNYVQLSSGLAKYLDVWKIREESGCTGIMVMLNVDLDIAFAMVAGIGDKVDAAMEKCIQKQVEHDQLQKEFPRCFGQKKVKMRNQAKLMISSLDTEETHRAPKMLRQKRENLNVWPV